MSQDLFTGKRIGAYLIHEELGKGGMAVVYKAYHERLHRYDAVKVILPHVASNPTFRARFEREAQVVASLDHQNIVKVYDFGEDGQIAYLAMQYISGGTLRSRMPTGQPLPQRQAVNYAMQMAHALHHAHNKGIVHRDVKPQNMLISGQNPDHLLLSDFGIAKLHDDSYEATQSEIQTQQTVTHPLMTKADQVVGTAKYMAPEQANKGQIDARTDVYALGVVLYQMLTGQTPFYGNTTLELMSHHIRTPPPPIRSINPTIPTILAHITAKALEKAPEARFQTAEEMALVLEEALKSTATRPHKTADQPFAHSSASGSQIPEETTSPSMRSIQPVDSKNTSIAAISPPKRVSKKRVPRWSVVVFLLALIALFLSGLITKEVQVLQKKAPVASSATFDETFKDNQLNWFSGSDYNQGLLARFEQNKYVLTTVAATTSGSSTNGMTYFPHPQNIGLLPANFTLRADMSQVKGDPTVLFGITFHVTFSASGDPSGYAFIIDSNGDYQLLKYHQGKYMVVYQGTSTAIQKGLGKFNMLQVIGRGSTITCFVNKKPVLLKETAPYLYSDSEFQNGYMSLLISGPETQFAVTEVQLTEP